MSGVHLRPPIPVGLIVIDPKRPKSRATMLRPPPTPATGGANRFRPGAVVVCIGLLLVACVGLMTFALRPVRQGVTETAYAPRIDSPDAASDLTSLPVEESEPVVTHIELGEARPSAHAPERPALPDIEGPEPGKTVTDERTPGGQFGTKINFARSQSIAFDRGVREQKLVLVLHLAGNFEDPGFT